MWRSELLELENLQKKLGANNRFLRFKNGIKICQKNIALIMKGGSLKLDSLLCKTSRSFKFMVNLRLVWFSL